MRKPLGILLAIALVVMLSGCLQVQRPEVPASILESADFVWRVEELETVESGELNAKSVETQYHYDLDANADGYPAVLVLVGLRTLFQIPPEDLLPTARDILQGELERNGVNAETVTEETGTRTLQGGATTQWLVMTGSAGSNSILFADAREIKVLAEAWFDPASNMHVVAIVIAQTVETDFFGREQRDHGTWNELVGDKTGTIQDTIHPEGFIDHVIIQN